MAVMPAQKPGRSVQDYQTPENFLKAVTRKFGPIYFDLAASAENRVVEAYYSEQDNALIQPWSGPAVPGLAWCNPPFGNLAPWVKHASLERLHGAEVLMLVPAGVGSNWWRDWVHHKAYVFLLNGRLTFVGQPTCYPKDCCLLYYTSKHPQADWYQVWSWQ